MLFPSQFSVKDFPYCINEKIVTVFSLLLHSKNKQAIGCLLKLVPKKNTIGQRATRITPATSGAPLNAAADQLLIDDNSVQIDIAQ